jgi:NhaA family Na+:H+ antiporter
LAANHGDQGDLPTRPIDKLLKPIERFLHVEAASGIVLLGCTLIALGLANSPVSADYQAFWKTHVSIQVGSFVMDHGLYHWVNDGLMAIFFFVIGLEVKREIVIGELRDARRAALPIAGAIGGMIVPAGIYLSLQYGEPAQDGWGIPMATDIAFVIGCMAVLGSRISHGFRVMILSLAIADDIGAILVIAIGYTDAIDMTALLLGLAGLVLVFFMARVGVRSYLAYSVVGIGIWLAFHESGVHATIAGVLLGLMTPTEAHVSQGRFRSALDRAKGWLDNEDWFELEDRAGKAQHVQNLMRETVSPVEYLERVLHPWVSFVIMPVFALANAGVAFELSDVTDPVAVAIMAGLVMGKPVGIVGASALAVRFGWASLPSGTGWRGMIGGGFLAGIGFTMALFIAGLALEGPSLDTAKVGILGASFVAAVIGMLMLTLGGRAATGDK